MAELRFDVTGSTTGAQRGLRDLASTSDLAARGARVLADSLDKQKRAAAASAGATLAAAKADKILADASDEAIASVVAERIELDKDRKAKEENAAATAALATSSRGAASGAAALVSPMGGLVAAGVALSPVIATLATGFGGLGLAAYSVSKNQQLMASTLAPLKAQFTAFSKSLQPVVLADFAAAAGLAGHVLKDIQPVAKTTGTALAQILGSVDAEFRSGEWQQFFGFMARTAAPDLQLLGASFTSLLRALPPLLQLLQPVAADILIITNAISKLVAVGSSASQGLDQTSKHMSALEQITTALRLALFAPGYGLHAALKLLGITGPAAAHGIDITGMAAKNAATHIGTMAQQVVALNSAESKSLNTQLAYSNALIAAGNDAKTLRQALHASAGQVGLHTAAQRASFSAANTYISDLETAATAAVASGKGAAGAARAIANGLPILTQAARHNHALWQEVQTLKGWLDKLRLEPAIREKINVLGIGKWSATAATHAIGQGPGPFAAGGLVRGGIPGRDSVPILATPGEAVVPTHLTAAVAPFLKAHGVPGFAAGGIIGDYSGTVAGLKPWSRHDLNATAAQITAGIAGAMASAFRSATAGFADTGARSGSAALAQSFARSILPRGWSWPALLSLWNQESGWNAYAVNPSSGAYGIPQSLGHGHPYNLGDYKAQIMWGLNYIANRPGYGSSQAAWAHEQAFGWYGSGYHGWVNKPTLIGVGERGRERVDVTPAGRRGAGAEIHNHFAAGSIREAADVDLLARRMAFQLDN